MMRKILVIVTMIMMAVGVTTAQNKEHRHNHGNKGHDHGTMADSTEHVLQEVTVTTGTKTRRLGGAQNGMRIGQQELFRAACCNLGESFSTNPSVDVSYNDAATGAKQIKLLGLAGTYVQMLTENQPAFRGAAAPFALGYVPGVWMKGINVSKGAASVKNGYESITGQIDIDYLKPEDIEGVNINIYGDLQSRFEANADGNIHLSKDLSTNLLLHYENRWGTHDSNSDGFQDMPSVRQYNMSNRWLYRHGKYIMHGGLSLLKEDRTSGQVHGAANGNGMPLYNIGIETDRYEGYMKHAFIIDDESHSNIALMANASMHDMSAVYGMKGWKEYDVNEKNVNAQVVYETKFGEKHALSTGVSLQHDYFSQHQVMGDGQWTMNDDDGRWTMNDDDGRWTMNDDDGRWTMNDDDGRWTMNSGKRIKTIEKETVPGAYAQYTYTLGTMVTAMAGIRWDNSSIYGTFITPRAHVKWQPCDLFSVRLAAGKGYRTPHILAENHNLLASGRRLVIDSDLRQEEAWNYGVSTAFYIPLGEKTMKLNAEYYYTDFREQAVIDYEMSPTEIVVHNLRGKSYSHVFQIDANYEFLRGLEATVAYRRNIVRSSYGKENMVMEKPLTSKYKGLLSLSYKTRLELWQFDVTLQMNGGGRIPATAMAGTLGAGLEGYQMDGFPTRFHSYEQLSAQVTRKFRHFDIYIGGENLTGYRQKDPIRNAKYPWLPGFDPTLIYAPIDGAMAYMGVRVKM